MDNVTKLLDSIDWGEAQKPLQKLVDDLNEAMLNFGKAVERALFPIVQAFNQFPVRLPNEHPVDYVLRRGAASGHFIYPDEAWRFRGNLDWWPGDEVDDQWGKARSEKLNCND